MTPDPGLAGWLQLSLTPGLGASTLRKLLGQFGLPEFHWFGHQTGRTPTAINNVIHGSMAVASGICHTAPK